MNDRTRALNILNNVIYLQHIKIQYDTATFFRSPEDLSWADPSHGLYYIIILLLDKLR